ncbi:DUF6716 putative glycosyltransferase [Microbacterium hominis]|uniref:Glycosyltransferase n=1 Tax=Microbacterium hominis TaxID=162426 RepID=A0A7D4PML3_9MICO|nr:DUF6716 putative glycosyltransferase [Microbacterium hominis]QKJ19630.1 hypothetical protein HQM25_09820 [Microbacterium hominis]
MTGPLRIVGLADTDSYVKWAAHLLGGLDAAWQPELLVVDTPLVVSDAQLAASVAGSGLADGAVRRADYDDLARLLADRRPDAVLIAARGPLVRVLARLVARSAPRPVIVTGLPGISIPATRKALVYRAQCDLFVVHSHREHREFARLAAERGLMQRFALARLPFATGAGDRQTGTDLVFAAQAKVPALRRDRLRLARMLVRAAAADPSRRVVVKLRAAAGEQQTHAEADSYPELLALIGRGETLPANLVTSTGSMRRALDRAEGLVTVSSTAAIEAVARGIPVIGIDTFGVGPELINEVFADGGLLGGERDVIERRYRVPSTPWCTDNYLHNPHDDDWAERTAALVEARRAGALPFAPPFARRGGLLRDAWERKSALGRHDRSVGGAVAFAVGLPARTAVRALQRVRRALHAARARDQQPGAEGDSPQVRSTRAVRTSTTRTP